MSPDDTTTKRCTKCGEEKPKSEFSKHKQGKEGLRPQCKACIHAYNIINTEQRRKYTQEYRAANIDRIKESNREYYAANADRINEYKKEYYAENTAKVLEKSRKYYAEHAEYARERNRKYYAANAEERRGHQRDYYKTPQGKASSRVASQVRRARKSNSPERFTREDLESIRASQTDRKGRLICWRCGKPIKDTPHLDHWIPLKHGGASSARNLHYMHAKCNLTKSSKHPAELGRLL